MEATPAEALAELLELQSGVVSRRQVLAHGLAEHDIRRMLRRREWAVVHPGVYVDHTGSLSYLQRCWAGVLFAWPAVVSHRSALRLDDGPGRHGRSDDEPIHIAMGRNRELRPPPGVRAHLIADISRKARWNMSPPRVRVEEAVVDVAAEAATDLDAIAELADAVRSRRTTPDRLLAALDGRSRLARRALLRAVIADLRDGTCSVLEHAFLAQVERAHGLPVADRQVRASSRGTIFRDVLYDAYSTVVELDGHTHHSSLSDRDRDLDRDLDAALDGLLTVRLGWGQVVARACATAAKLGRLLQSRGWPGALVSCPSCVPVSAGTRAATEPAPAIDSPDSQPPGACESGPSSDDLPAA